MNKVSCSCTNIQVAPDSASIAICLSFNELIVGMISNKLSRLVFVLIRLRQERSKSEPKRKFKQNKD